MLRECGSTPSRGGQVVRSYGDGAGWYVDVSTRQLCVPHDFEAAELVSFLQRCLPRLIRAAQASPELRSSAARERKAGAAARERQGHAPGPKNPYV